MTTLDREQLKSRKAGETEDVTLAGGGTVRVRGLNRAQVKQARADAEGDDDVTENHLIAAAMVAPEMTPADVAEWLDEAPAGDAVAVMEVVSRLSNMGEGAQKSRVAKARARRRR